MLLPGCNTSSDSSNNLKKEVSLLRGRVEGLRKRVEVLERGGKTLKKSGSALGLFGIQLRNLTQFAGRARLNSTQVRNLAALMVDEAKRIRAIAKKKIALGDRASLSAAIDKIEKATDAKVNTTLGQSLGKQWLEHRIEIRAREAQELREHRAKLGSKTRLDKTVK